MFPTTFFFKIAVYTWRMRCLEVTNTPFVLIKINASEAVRIISVVYNAEKEKGLQARTKGDHWRKETGALQMT